MTATTMTATNHDHDGHRIDNDGHNKDGHKCKYVNNVNNKFIERTGTEFLVR